MLAKVSAVSVFIVESGDYEQRGIDLVAASREAAIEAMKARYGPPYKVEWSLNDDGDLIGVFEGVPHYSAPHTKYCTITEYEVVGHSGLKS